MRLYLGVDGGQSSTTALIGDESGRVTGFGSGGPCNHVAAAEGREKLVRAVTECVSAACAQAGVDFASAEFEAACLGLSGGPEDKRAILEEILRARRMVVTNDALIALAGATAGEAGLITIAGTGSIAFGRNREGKTARAGGWGHLFGDEGGGFDLTRQALRAALAFEEGWGAPTALREVLLVASGASSANDLMHRCYTPEFPRPKIASFAVLVDHAARSGDPLARQTLEKAAQDLATLAMAVRRQLFQPGEPAHVAYIGGVFRSEILLLRFRTLLELEEGNLVGPPIHSPAAGALIEAYRAANIAPQLTNLPTAEK